MYIRLFSFLNQPYLSVFHHDQVFTAISYALSSPPSLFYNNFITLLFEPEDAVFEHLNVWTDFWSYQFLLFLITCSKNFDP